MPVSISNFNDAVAPALRNAAQRVGFDIATFLAIMQAILAACPKKTPAKIRDDAMEAKVAPNSIRGLAMRRTIKSNLPRGQKTAAKVNGFIAECCRCSEREFVSVCESARAYVETDE